MNKPNPDHFPLLFAINNPTQLRELPESQLQDVVQELREYLLQAVNVCGGHLGASLGTTELTVALHYLFDTPNDRFVWDVGHQAYPHKILTGRRDRISTIKQTDGLAPFPRREESPFDAFGVGHSSTSIGAALGMAVAAEKLQQSRKVVAIIGDGAMTAGMAFEALNHAGDVRPDLLVILNDNNMSISPNVGALSNYLARAFTGKIYSSVREGSKKVLRKLPPAWELIKRTEAHMKGMFTPGMLFEELGFNYFGPIDGHDLPTLIKTLRNLKTQTGPRLLHIITQKGKGYGPAEADPVAYHAVKAGFYDKQETSPTKKVTKPTYSKIFGDWLCEMAERDERVVGITPAMREGSGMVEFSKRFPDRYFDVGIAEQHSVTLAAGMACEGLRPVVAIYSTFLQRAYDQLIHDVAIQNLPVLFAIDRGGVVGGDGSTHNGAFDLSYLRCIPNMTVMTPSDENECRRMLTTGLQINGPSAVRYPRGSGSASTIETSMQALAIGKAQIKRQGKRIAILAFGSMLQAALIVGEQLNTTVVNMRFVKPLDQTLITQLANDHELIVTVEENAIMGGAGSAVNEFLQQANIVMPILNLGLPDEFIEHGDPAILLQRCGLDASGIRAAIEKRCKQLSKPSVIITEETAIV